MCDVISVNLPERESVRLLVSVCARNVIAGFQGDSLKRFYFSEEGGRYRRWPLAERRTRQQPASNAKKVNHDRSLTYVRSEPYDFKGNVAQFGS